MVLARARLSTALRRRVSPSDLVQETLLRGAQEHEVVARLSDAQMVAWIERVVQNLAINLLRDHRRARRDVRREIALDSSGNGRSDASLSSLAHLASRGSSNSDRAAREEELFRVSEAIMALPDQQREAIVLHYIEERTIAETGQLMGRSVDSVAGLLRRGLQKIRESLPMSK